MTVERFRQAKGANTWSVLDTDTSPPTVAASGLLRHEARRQAHAMNREERRRRTIEREIRLGHRAMTRAGFEHPVVENQRLLDALTPPV